MNEKQTEPAAVVRPTKKQRQLLEFIETFINEHGYSPSYREIMGGQQYTSVATVALHVNNLIKRGHLRKRDHSARSLEVVQATADTVKITSNQVAVAEEKWLVEKVEHIFGQAEAAAAETVPAYVQQLQILLASLKILGLEAAAQSFATRMKQLKQRAPQT